MDGGTSRPASPVVRPCIFPSTTLLGSHAAERAYFHDAYSVVLRRPEASVADLFFAVFGHRPAWMKYMMIARNKAASLYGIGAPSVAEILHPEIKPSYRVGEKIGAWPIFGLTDTELVAGRDNRHLDFRLSILKATDGPATQLVVSTVCFVHNRYGALYLSIIVPFHKWGVQRLMSNAVRAGRL